MRPISQKKRLIKRRQQLSFFFLFFWDCCRCSEAVFFPPRFFWEKQVRVYDLLRGFPGRTEDPWGKLFLLPPPQPSFFFLGGGTFLLAKRRERELTLYTATYTKCIFLVFLFFWEFACLQHVKWRGGRAWKGKISHKASLDLPLQNCAAKSPPPLPAHGIPRILSSI